MKSLLSKKVIFSSSLFRVTNLSSIVSVRGKEEEVHPKSKESLSEKERKKGDKNFLWRKNQINFFEANFFFKNQNSKKNSETFPKMTRVRNFPYLYGTSVFSRIFP